MSNEQTKPLSQEEIKTFAAEWYRMLDEHVPLEELLPLVAEQSFEMQLPEGTIRGVDGFQELVRRGWYENFFDELHTLTTVNPVWRDNRAMVEVVVNWQARRWRPPAPRSEWIGFDAYQRWEMIRSPATGEPVILRYIVDELRPMPGSPPL